MYRENFSTYQSALGRFPVAVAQPSIPEGEEPVRSIERTLVALFAAGIAGCKWLMAQDELSTIARLEGVA
jgi:hypothetical protein